MFVTSTSLRVLSDARLREVEGAFINRYEEVRDLNGGSRVAAAASPVGAALHVIAAEMTRRRMY